jgi:hypothetical protein
MADNIIPDLQMNFDFDGAGGPAIPIGDLIGDADLQENPGLENYDEARNLSDRIKVLMDSIPISILLENYLRNEEGQIPVFPLTEDQTRMLREGHDLMNQLKQMIRESIVNGTNITDNHITSTNIYDYDMTDDQFMNLSNGQRPENVEELHLLRRLHTAGMPYGIVHSIDFSKNGRSDVNYLTHLLVDNGETVLNLMMNSIICGFRIELNPADGEIQLINPPIEEDNIFTHEWSRIDQFSALYHANEEYMVTMNIH